MMGGNGWPRSVKQSNDYPFPPGRDTMQLTVYIWSWVILAVVVLCLALYRFTLAGHEDESLRLSDFETPKIAEQKQVFGKLNRVEFWGKLLTVVVILYGLAIAGAYLYHSWMQSGQVQG